MALMTKGACLLCDYFKPVPPDGWKPRYEGDHYDIYDVRKTMCEASGKNQEGLCALNPVHVDVWTNHTCSHYRPIDAALMSLTNFVWGGWQQNERKEKEEKIAELSRQLKTARKISHGRLQRIRRLKRMKR